MEWENKSKYNSFNSYKGLAYYENYKGIVKWLEGKGSLPAPIECSLDPIARCNESCYFCNSQRYLRENPLEIPPNRRRMSREYMVNLIDFLADWGVRGVCFGGGGESLLNKDTWPLFSYIRSKGMETSVVTNGTVMNETLLDELMNCRWVGFSINASDRVTFNKIHGVDLFDKVVNNMRDLAKKQRATNSNVDIAFKILVLPENIDSLYSASKLAKDIGVRDFHVRPVDLERKDYRMARRLNLDIPKIKEIFAKCHEEETENFRVFTVMHKYDEQFHVKHAFNKCLAAPLVIQCCTDGYVYQCVDHRIEKRFRLGAHYPKPEKILDWWGNDSHRQLLVGINPHRECSRCTWSEYNSQIEEVVMEDKMCLSFP